MTELQALLLLVAAGVILGGLFTLAGRGRSEAPPEGTPFDPPPRG